MLLRIVAFMIPTLLGLQAAIQFVAHRFHYQPALGEPILTWGEWWVYAPWQYTRWMAEAGVRYPGVFNYSYLMVMGGFMIGAGLVFWLEQQGQDHMRDEAHPSARWATSKEIRQRKLW